MLGNFPDMSCVWRSFCGQSPRDDLEGCTTSVWCDSPWLTRNPTRYWWSRTHRGRCITEAPPGWLGWMGWMFFFTETNNKLCDCLWHRGDLVFFLPSYIICLFRLGIPNVGSLDHHKPKKLRDPKMADWTAREGSFLNGNSPKSNASFGPGKVVDGTQFWMKSTSNTETTGYPVILRIDRKSVV